jgi:small subunit ribosomal protein S17
VKPMIRNIGLDVKLPKSICEDHLCPFHGNHPLRIRGRIFIGVVQNNKMNNTVIVRRDYLIYSRKYERYARSRSTIPAHNPPCIDAKIGDKVKIAECRPVSKTVSFVVIEKLEE